TPSGARTFGGAGGLRNHSERAFAKPLGRPGMRWGSKYDVRLGTHPARPVESIALQPQKFSNNWRHKSPRRQSPSARPRPPQSLTTIGAATPTIRLNMPKRFASGSRLPDIPSVAEFVPGYESSGYFGFGAPAKTPAEIVDKLNKEINAGLADPKMKARLADLGGAVLAGSPADFGKLIAEETEKWGKVIRAANIKPESKIASRASREDRYEPPPSAISASGRGRCRAARRIAHRAGASLSVATGTHHRAVRSGRRVRHHGAPDRSVVVGAARPAICYREPTGRRRQYRHRGGRARACRRLHAADGRER